MGARAARAGKSSGSSKKLKIIIPIAVIVLILVVGGFFAFDIFNDFKGANVSEEKSIVKIAEIDTIKEVAAKLKDAGIIKYSWAAEAFYKIKDFKRDFIAGDIELNKNSSYTDIFDKIIQPKTARQTVSIRFPEGRCV